jgi:hypothetical protein
VTGGLVTYEWYTEARYLENLRSRISALRELASINITTADKTSEVDRARHLLLQELTEYRPHRISLPTIGQLDFAPFMKFVTGSLLGVLALVFAFFGKADDRFNTAVAGVFLAVVGGLIAIAIPTPFSPWLNYIGAPMIYFLLAYLYSARNRPNSNQHEAGN